MADINRVVLVGRLVRDAELRYTSGGLAICKFSVAINRRRKVGDAWEDEANFFDVVVFGRQGEAINEYLVKGKQVGIDGELHQSRWEQDGQTRSRVEINAYNVQLLGGGGNRGNGGGGGQPAQSRTNKSPENTGDSYADSDSPGGEFEDDIPF